MKRATVFAIVFATVIGAVLVSLPVMPLSASEPGWRPVASERLVKLPAAYLKKAIDKDFAGSALGAALAKNRESGDLKAATLDDLARAQDSADGELRLDLRHQLLGEKQSFIRIMGERQRLERKRTKARLRLLQSLIVKIDQGDQTRSHGADKIRASQAEARQRFESSLATVDDTLFASGMASDSRYAQAHARNVAAIEQLRRAISAHPMNRASDPALQDMTKREYLEHMVIEAEAGLAVLDQEEQVLGYMAKLVALDAMAFADELEGADQTVASAGDAKAPILSSAVQFFIRN